MNSIDGGLLLIKLFLPFALAIPFLTNDEMVRMNEN
jgi:hypothetical protein